MTVTIVYATTEGSTHLFANVRTCTKDSMLVVGPVYNDFFGWYVSRESTVAKVKCGTCPLRALKNRCS